MERLSVQRIAVQAVRACAGLRRELLKVMALPLAVYLTLIALIGRQWQVSSPFTGLFLFLVGGAAITLAAVACHRVMLLGPVSVPRFGLVTLGPRELRFMLTGVAIWALTSAVHFACGAALAPFGVDMKELGLWQIAAMTPGYYLMSRLSLMLPAIAVDSPMLLRDAWRLSSGNGWALTVLITGLPWLFEICAWLLAQWFPFDAQLLVQMTLYASFLPLLIALLSLSYRQLLKRR